MGVDGFEEDVLDGESELVAGVELAAALGLADVDPVGGAMAGATEALALRPAVAAVLAWLLLFSLRFLNGDCNTCLFSCRRPSFSCCNTCTCFRSRRSFCSASASSCFVAFHFACHSAIRSFARACWLRQ